MQFKAALLLLVVSACLASACGGGDSLVPKLTPTLQAGSGPAVARTPFGGTRPGTTPGAAAPVATPPPTPAPIQTYTVASGDTPNAIANKLNIPSDRIEAWVAQMLSLNNTTASGLQIGQELKLPPGATSAPAPAPGPNTGPGTAPGTPRPLTGSPSPGAPVIVQLTSPVGRVRK